MAKDPSLMSRLAESRSKAYSMLAMFYLKRPTREFLEMMSKGSPQLEGVDEEIAEALRTIRKEVLKADNLEDYTLRLGVEFTRLFRGVKEGYSPPPPYESVYRGEGRLYGYYTLQVIEAYRKAGYYPGEEHLSPPDYISAELEFMAYLAQREATAWRKGNVSDARRLLKMEKEFLAEHLLLWVPEFCKRVEEQAKESFYKAVARLTKRFLKLDYEAIKELT